MRWTWINLLLHTSTTISCIARSLRRLFDTGANMPGNHSDFSLFQTISFKFFTPQMRSLGLLQSIFHILYHLPVYLLSSL